MKALNRILKGYNRTISKLEKLSDKNEKRIEINVDEIDYLEAQIMELKQKNLQLLLEAEEARKVAEKIRSITSVSDDQ